MENSDWEWARNLENQRFSDWDWPNTEFEYVSDEELIACLGYWVLRNHEDYIIEIQEEVKKRIIE